MPFYTYYMIVGKWPEGTQCVEEKAAFAEHFFLWLGTKNSVVKDSFCLSALAHFLDLKEHRLEIPTMGVLTALQSVTSQSVTSRSREFPFPGIVLFF